MLFTSRVVFPTLAFGLITLPSPVLAASVENPRVGTAMIDADGKVVHVQNGDARFPMCSTFKFLTVARVLQRVDRGEEKPDRFIKYTERDLLAWAPVTKQHVSQGGMTLEALCFAAIAYSDNAAANLLVDSLGGTNEVTAFARTLGDAVTRLDRKEPDLNDTAPGDPRDTTTPVAMLHDMQKILLGDVLSASSREKLESWLVQNTTGDAMIRSVVPKDWRVGDKTGSNMSGGNTNDIAIIRRADGRTMLICIYLEAPGLPADARAKMVANEARRLLSP